MRNCIGLLVLLLACTLRAAGEGSPVTDSLFNAELMKVLVEQSRHGSPTLATLSLSAQYSRRRAFDEQGIYQRGPYDLVEQAFRSGYRYRLSYNRAGAPAGDAVAPEAAMRTVVVAPNPVAWYVAAMLVKGTGIGETPDARGLGTEYLVRVAAVPTRYHNDTLEAEVLLQRARLDARPDLPNADVVYRRAVALRGNEPLALQLPRIDPSDETVEEIALTLETPTGFGLAQNNPDPVTSRTMIAYALPARSRVHLIVATPNGRVHDTLVDAIQEAGLYRALWDGTRRPSGSYAYALEAVPTATGIPFYRQLGFSKLVREGAEIDTVPMAPDSILERFPVTTIPLEAQRTDRTFRLFVEGGAAYLDPPLDGAPFDNMFSHVALGLGITVTEYVEAGMLFGQDGFHHERAQANPIIVPSSDQTIETRIVAWGGGYARFSFALGGTRAFLHLSAAAAGGGAVSTIGLGAMMTFANGFALYLMPHRTDQWDVHPLTKWGVDYGLAFHF